MVTDPQSPKSIWWYSDCNDVGFRVVREYEPEPAPVPITQANAATPAK
jgi:hypothetical protein